MLRFIKKFFPVTFITDNKKTVKQRLFKQKLELAYDVYLHEQYRCVKPIICSHKSIGFKQFQRCNNKVFQTSPQPNHLKIITFVSYFAVIATLTKDAFSSVKISFRFFVTFNTFAQVFRK